MSDDIKLRVQCYIILADIQWFVGSGGTSSSDCGYNTSNPCLNVQHLAVRIESTYRYDTIFMLPSEDIFEHCMTKPLKRRVKIIGLDFKVRLGCGGATGNEYGTILMFQGEGQWPYIPVILIRGISFVTGYITGVFAPMVVENCYFDEATIHLGGLEPYWSNSTPGFPSDSNIPFPYPGSLESLVLNNNTWNLIIQNSYSTVDAYGFRLTITISAWRTFLEMNNNQFANRRVFVVSRNELTFSAKRNVFHGNQNNETMIGGITILYHFTYASIIIEECSFKNLIPRSVSLAALYDHLFVFWNRPLIIQSQINDARDLSTPQPNVKIHVNDTVFDGNLGGLKYDGSAKHFFVTNSTFSNNYVLFEGGGAISAREGGNAWTSLLIIDSVFDGNMAGISEVFPGQSLDSTELSHQNGLVNVSLINGTLSFSKPLGVSFDVISDGGALSLRGLYASITNSIFINNTAKRFGGAIVVRKCQQFNVQNITVEGSNSDSSLEGVLVYITNTESNIYDSQFLCYSSGHDMFYYSSNARELDLNSVLFTCSKENLLTQHETIKTNRGTYKSLRYKCDFCDNAYNFGDVSKAFHWHGNISHSQIVCYPCPYGAVCREGQVRVQHNFWAEVRDKKLHVAKCPQSYCCSNGLEETCPMDNSCMSNRDGVLCGQCKSGFSDTLFSVKCIQSEMCKSTWAILSMFMCCLMYSAFLLFHRDFINGITRCVRSCISSHPPSQANEDQSFGEGGGIDFIVMLFYYFQDVSLITTQAIHTIPLSMEILMFMKFRVALDAFFQFGFEIFGIITPEICAFKDLSKQENLILEASFVPLLLSILSAIYGISKGLMHFSTECGTKLLKRAVSALVIALILSYQKVIVTAFRSIVCVSFVDHEVLLINGNVMCYQPWQFMIMIFAVVWIIPFFCVIALGPGLLKDHHMSYKAFMLACLIPLPCLTIALYHMAGKKKHHARGHSKALSIEAEQVVSVLQGSYHKLRLPSNFGPFICWTGLLIANRLLMVLAKTIIMSPLSRQLGLGLVVTMNMLLQARISPYKSSAANTLGAFLSFSLLILAMLNVIRATFIETNYNPVGPLENVVHVMNIVESVFLVWLPFVGSLVFLVAIALAAIVFLCSMVKVCVKRKPKKVNVIT